MSLDQLPNELIAHIGSYMSFKDNLQFGLCQKRIHAVLKREGLLKPECKTLKFSSVAHPHCKFWLPDSTELSIEEETRDPKFNSAVGQIINKFRKIEVIDFYGVMEKMTEDIFKDLMKTKTKLSSLNIYDIVVDAVDTNIFIAACKKFNKIKLDWIVLPTKLLCDQAFVELIPHTSFSLMNFHSGPFDGYSLTDRTLKALTDVGVREYFEISAILTSFTIAGIKTLVEEVLKKDLDLRYNLGILKRSEERNAVRWMEQVAADPDCPYRIHRNAPFGDDIEMFRYSISLKDITRRKMHIGFDTNPVEV